MEDSDETAESIEGLRGAVGLVSARFGRDGGGMAVGDNGGEMPADERRGAETFRSWAYEDSFTGGMAPLLALFGGVGGLVWVGVAALDECCSSSASRASSFSRGERGSKSSP